MLEYLQRDGGITAEARHHVEAAADILQPRDVARIGSAVDVVILPLLHRQPYPAADVGRPPLQRLHLLAAGACPVGIGVV
jgi:hypothetical protein